MSNQEIVTRARFELMKAGMIGGTGRMIPYMDAEGNKHELAEPEEIHTYQRWQELGFQVQKGEKAVVFLTIWKKVVSKKKEADEASKETGGTYDRMIMKRSAFFSRAQVAAAKAA